MKKALHVSRDLALPLDAITQTIVVYGANTMSSSGILGAGQASGWVGTGAANTLHVRANGTEIGGASSMCFGTVVFGGSTAMSGGFPSTPPALNGGYIPFPIFVGAVLASNDGWVGTRIDAFWMYLGTNAAGVVVDDVSLGTRIALIGTHMIPWDPTKTVVTT